MRVAVFFSYRMSIRTWQRLGIYSREMRRYSLISGERMDLMFVTYDWESPNAEGRGKSTFLFNRHRLPDLLYSFLAPVLHYRELRSVDAFFTHQISGSWTAMLAKFLHQKSLVSRAGYFWAELARARGKNWWLRKIVQVLEFCVTRFSDGVICTASPVRRMDVPSWQRLAVIPNGIDTDLFSPFPKEYDGQEGLTFIYIGRLSPEKNLTNFFQALIGFDARLVLVGDGPERPALAEMSARNGLHVDFRGTVPNERISKILNLADVFVLPSITEGNPKALLEAMSCGLAVVSTKWNGADEIIRHMQNGVLCETSADSIRSALQTLSGDSALRRRLGQEARATAVRDFDLERNAAREGRFIREIAGRVPVAQVRGVP